MHHPHIDTYAEMDSLIHALDPRVKILSAVFIILGIVLTEPTAMLSFLLYAVFLSLLIKLSRLPLLFIFTRSLVIIPFVLMIAIFIPFYKEGDVAGAYSFGTINLTVTYDGLTILWNVLAKSYLSILCLIIFTACTKFSVLLKALEKLKVPALLIMIFSFMYRYSFLIVDELMRMKQAKDSRSIAGSKLFHVKTLANMLGTLFINSYERAESVYMAMRSRGFSGAIYTLYEFKLGAPDIAFAGSVIIFVTITKLVTQI